MKINVQVKLFDKPIKADLLYGGLISYIKEYEIGFYVLEDEKDIMKKEIDNIFEKYKGLYSIKFTVPQPKGGLK